MEELWFHSKQGKDFCLLQKLKPDPGMYLAFCSVDTGGLFPQGKVVYA